MPFVDIPPPCEKASDLIEPVARDAGEDDALTSWRCLQACSPSRLDYDWAALIVP